MLTGWQSRGWGASRFGGEEGEEDRRPQLSEPALLGDSVGLQWTVTHLGGRCSPLAHLQRELRDLPTRHAGDPETHCHSRRVFGVLSRAVSGVRAGGRAPVLGEQRAALRTEAEGASGPAGLSGWLCPVLTPGVVEAQSSGEALKHPWVHILSWDPRRGSLRAEAIIPCRIWSLALVLKQREIRVSLRRWHLWFHLGHRETQSERWEPSCLLPGL